VASDDAEGLARMKGGPKAGSFKKHLRAEWRLTGSHARANRAKKELKRPFLAPAQ